MTYKECKKAFAHIRSAIMFLFDDNTYVCTPYLPSPAISYYNKQGDAITPITKAIGSPLTSLLEARDVLGYEIFYKTARKNGYIAKALILDEWHKLSNQEKNDPEYWAQKLFSPATQRE